MSFKNLSYHISSFVKSLKINQIPDEVVEKAKLHVLDTLGIILATHNFPENIKAIELIKEIGGSPESTVIGHGFKTSCINAAFANSLMSHSVDYDDTHLGSVIHQSTTIVPTALAVAEKAESSGEEMLEAIIAGYEINANLGLIAPAKFHLRGFHPTSVIGVFGSVVTASKLLKLNENEIENALGIAGSMCVGILQGIKEGVPIKPFHPALASHLGIMAALLAKKGYTGPKFVFEGEWGVFNTYLKGENFDFEIISRNLGKSWETMNISFKPYPACHATHSAIDIAIKFRNKYGVKLSDIDKIEFFVPKITIELVVEPIEEKLRPSTPYSAKFSLPYTVIKAIENGWVGIWDFTDTSIRDEKIISLLPLVKVQHEKEYDKYGDKVIPAKAKLYTKEGKVYEEEVIDHKGTPNNPLTEEDVINKFRNNVSPLRMINYEQIIKTTLNLEKFNIYDLINELK